MAQGLTGLSMSAAALDVLQREGLAPVRAWAVWWILMSGGLALMLAHAMHRRHFGQPGLRGARVALMAQLRSFLVAVPLAGTLVVPVHGTLYAPLVLAQAQALMPIVVAMLVLALAIHGQNALALRARAAQRFTSRESCG